jgi:hypothetical protein
MRRNKVNYKIAVNWQEDEGGPTGTMYFVEVMRLDDWNTVIVETKHYNMNEAWNEALIQLQIKGEL